MEFEFEALKLIGLLYAFVIPEPEISSAPETPSLNIVSPAVLIAPLAETTVLFPN